MQTAFAGFSWPDGSLLLLRLLCAATLLWLIPTLLMRLFGRRWSASLRHRVWSMSTAAVLMLPALIVLLPDWRVAHFSPASGAPLLPLTTDAKDAPTRAGSVSSARASSQLPKPLPPLNASQDFGAAFDIPWAACSAIVWVVVCAWLIFRQLIAIAWAARMLRRAQLIPEEDSAAGKLRQLSSDLNCRSTPLLKTSDEIPSPMCVGLFRPSIVLPEDYSTWPEPQRDAVLAHELAHAMRRDVFWQAAARVACALYWFHPLSWSAARQMHAERELACDDSVLRGGQESTQYARLLVQLAEVIAALPKPAELAGVGMASRHRLQQRVHALLEPTRRRNTVSRFGAIVLSTTGMVIVVLAAMLDPLAAPELRADESATQPAAILSPDVEQLLKDLAVKEAALQNLTIRAESWDEFSPNEGRNDWQKDKSHSVVHAWYTGSPMQQGRFDVHDDVVKWINGAAPFSEQSYSVTFDGKVGKYIKFLDGAIGDVHEHHVATISAGIPGMMPSRHNAAGGTYSIFYFGRGKGISSFFRQYFATLRAHDPAIPITVTLEKFNGAGTLRLTIGTPAKVAENYWFDTAHGLALLALRTTAHERDGREICSSVLAVSKLAEVGPKIWFPMELEYYFGGWYPDPADNLIGKSRGSYPRQRSHFVASECKANDPRFDAGIFSPEIPEGFMVNDQVAKTNSPAAKPKKADPALEQMLTEKIGSK